MTNHSSKGEQQSAENAKQRQLDQYRISNVGKPMTTNEGRKISNDEALLTAGERGPLLSEDYHYFEKLHTLCKKNNQKG